MARQLTPFGRFLLVLCGLALIGYGLWRYGVLDRIARVLAPDRKAEGTVSRDDFGPVSPGGTAPVASKASLAGGSRLGRPIKVAIVTWGGYAGGIVANGGFAPNKDSVFYKDFGVQVELLVIDDFEKSRDAFRAGGRQGRRRHHVVDGGRLRPRIRRPPPAEPQGDPAVRLEPRRRRDRGGRVHQERRRPPRQEAGLRGGDALALLRALRPDPGRPHQPRRELGVHRPRRWRRPTSSRPARWTRPCPGRPTSTSRPASGQGGHILASTRRPAT